jgi:serine/threonine protein kinase
MAGPDHGERCHVMLMLQVRPGKTNRHEPASMSLEDSLVLGRYRVLWPIESKKLIKTYIARDEHRDALGTPVLVKHHLHDLGNKDSDLAVVMYDELGRLTQLRHPGVVSLLDHGSVGQCLVTAHSCLPGIGLQQLCDLFGKRQEQFPPHFAIYIARRLLETLQHCQTRRGGGFVHGRLTLGCIHLPTTGEPQIADFGLAALEDVAAEAELQLGFFQTRMSYSAPELTRGGSASAQGDTYSVALLLYRLLAGSNPFRGRSIPETLQRVLQLSPADLMMPEWEGCSRVNALLRRALDKDPEARFQSSQELGLALRAVEIRSDETLREEFAPLIRQHAGDDWAQIARLTRSVRRAAPAARRDEPSSHATFPLESKAPAFVSGLITEQPISGHEQREGTRGGARNKRERRRQMLMVPTVLIPAAAIIFGLFLGRLGGAGVSANAARALAAQDEAPPLVNAMVEDLRTQFRRCASERLAPMPPTEVELEFGSTGALGGVRLNPHELSHSRLGACLLETAWVANLRAPGAMSIKIPVR